MVVARKIAYNVVISSISKVLSTILALVGIGFITRYLGKEGFGDYATVLAFLSFFAAIADLGLYSIVTREISREGASEERIIGNVMAVRLVSSLAVFILSPIIVYFFDYPDAVKRGILIVAGSFVFSSSYQVLNGIFQKNLVMDRVALSELLGKISQVIFIISAIYLELGFEWIVGSLLVNMVVSFFLVYFFSRRYIKIKLLWDWQYWRHFLKESVPMGVATIVTFVYFKMDTITLSILKSSADVGIYNVAYKVLENITFFPAMITGLVMPIMSKNIFSNQDRFFEVANKTFKVFLILVLPLIIGVLFLADGIISLIGGNGFQESGLVLRILVFALAFIFFGQFFNTILIVGNLQKKLMWTLGFVAVFNVIANLVFIPRYSYLASSYISVVTEFLVVLITSLIVYKKIEYRPSFDGLVGVLMSGLIMAIFLWFFQEWPFLIKALSSSILYFAFLRIFNIIKKDEIISLVRK